MHNFFNFFVRARCAARVFAAVRWWGAHRFIAYAASGLVGWISFGTCFYHFDNGWPWCESFYYTTQVTARSCHDNGHVTVV